MWRGLMGNSLYSNGKLKNASKEMKWESINSGLPSLEKVPIEQEFNEATRKNRFLWFCYVLSQVVSFAAVASCCLHIYHISFPDSTACLTDSSTSIVTTAASTPAGLSLADIAIIVTRVYAIAFNLLLVIHEREYHIAFLERYTSLLDPWISRGLFIIFSASLQVSTIRYCAESLTMSMSIVFAILGALYFTMGILCLGRYQTMAVNQIRKRKLMLLQAQQLNEQKSEIEEMLQEAETKIARL